MTSYDGTHLALVIEHGIDPMTALEINAHVSALRHDTRNRSAREGLRAIWDNTDTKTRRFIDSAPHFVPRSLLNLGNLP